METLRLLGAVRPLVTETYKINYVQKRSAVDLARKIHGPAPSANNIPIIVLHGLLGSKRNWDSMCIKISLATKRTVIAVDARNHGESPHHASHTYLDLASDVSKLLATYSIEKASIIGHSMGGRTGMVLALTEPSKVANLIVVDISPVSTAGVLNNFFPKVIEAMKLVNFNGMDNLVKAKKAAADAIIATGLVKNMEGLNFILMNIGKKADNTLGWMCNTEALKKHFMNIASFPREMTGKSYHGPTLFIGGERSKYLPLEDITGIRQFFPQAELKYIPGVGHNVHAEDPPAFLYMVVDFLTRNTYN